MPIEETLNIDTPENVSFDYEIAGIGSRFTAAFIDTFIIVALQVLTYLVILFVVMRTNSAVTVENVGTFGAWAIALIGLIAFLLLWGYYIFFEMLWNGQTPGKRIINLRVIRTDGTSITLTESVIRNLVRLADFLPAFYGIGTVAIFINRQTRRLGDLAAGTLVVREKTQQVTLTDLAALHKAAQPQTPSRDLDEPFQTTYPVNQLNYQDAQMIESFFQRQKELTNRGALAGQLLKRLLAKMGVTVENDGTMTDAEQLKKILSEYRQIHNEK